MAHGSETGRSSGAMQGIWLQLLLFAAVFAVVQGCSCSSAAEPVDVDEDAVGRIGVNTATTGVDPDPDGYTMVLDATRTTGIPSTGQTSFPDVPPGSHTLGITDVAANCSVTSVTAPSGANLGTGLPVSLTLFPGTTDFYNFALACVANLGEIIVSNSTDGDPGVEAYTVTVSGESRPFPPGFNVFFDVPVGDHTVALSDVPEQCFVIGDNPATASVEFGGSETVFYRIDCTGERGTLRVTTRTTGASLDPDGYNVSVNGQVIIFASEGEFSHDFDLLPAGPLDVHLTNVSDNCTFQPASPVTATVVVNQVTEVVFDVMCAAAGEVDVSVTTTGASLDPDGYTVTVGEKTFPAPVNTTSPITFENVIAGNVDVLLDGVASNCTVGETNPLTVQVVADQTTAVAFTVSCVGTGALEVTTQTTGGAAPADGFGLRIAGDFHTIGANETQTFTPVVAGNVEVRLDTEESPTCVVAGDNPRVVEVIQDQTATTTFQVNCPIPTPPVLFESSRTGDFNVFAMNPDGSGVLRLTPDDAFDDLDPSWSWENDRIVFVSDRGGQTDIWVMDPDGSNPVQLTNTAAENEDPAFSPDGSRIVYEEEDPDDGTLEIFIMNADGSNPVQLTDAPNISEAPQFSRDGSTILFKSNRSNNDFDVYTMNPDGSNVVALTNAAGDDFDPSFSPDMTTIIFSSQRDGAETLYLMDADGSNERRFSLPVQHDDWHPVFSTDGMQVIFTSDRFAPGTGTNDYELWIVNVDGTGLTRLTNNARTDDDAEFRKPIL